MIERTDCLKCKNLKEISDTLVCGTSLIKTYICLKNKHKDKEVNENYYCDEYEEVKE